MHSDKLKQLVIDSIEEMKGQNIHDFSVEDVTDIADFMVIASGTSNRHVKSIANNLVIKAKEQGIQLLGVEGEDVAEWVLVDFGDVVAHIMLPETRTFYDLEKLWVHGSPTAKQEGNLS